MLRAVVGHEGPKHALLHALAADMLAEVGAEVPAVAEAQAEAPPGSPAADGDGEGVRGNLPEVPRRVGRGREARRRRQAEKKAKRILHRLLARMGGLPAVSWPAPAGDLASLSLAGRLAHAQRLASWRRGLEWQRARLLALFRARAWHRAAGFHNFFEWLDRRLCLGPREAVTLCRLAHDLSPLREIEDAWRDGALGWFEAGMVARVASPDTAADWASFAAATTKKRLEIDIAAHVALRCRRRHAGASSPTVGGHCATCPARRCAFTGIGCSTRPVTVSGRSARRAGRHARPGRRRRGFVEIGSGRGARADAARHPGRHRR